MTDSPLSHLARAALLAVVFTSAVSSAANGAPGLPNVVQQSVPAAAPLGQGQLRFLGLRIYDARLWVNREFRAEDFAEHPLALELRYHRAFTGDAIAQRSIDEIERQGQLAPALSQRWRQALTRLLPDVQPGDRLIGLYQPGRGMQLWRGEHLLGAVDDAALARRFFAIWLSPEASDPRLRDALLGRGSGGLP